MSHDTVINKSALVPVRAVRKVTSALSMFRPIRSSPTHLLTRHVVKCFSEKITPETSKVPSDPRPPWVYSISAGLRLALIPSACFYSSTSARYSSKHREGILFYAVFFADFGEKEHVFMPVCHRRSAARCSLNCYSLSRSHGDGFGVNETHS
jgi:hypothetical protein